MKNLFKNALLTVLIAYTVFTLLQGQHGALFIPGLIFVMGMLHTMTAFDEQRQNRA